LITCVLGHAQQKRTREQPRGARLEGWNLLPAGSLSFFLKGLGVRTGHEPSEKGLIANLIPYICFLFVAKIHPSHGSAG
jgi:hypothetical protein